MENSKVKDIMVKRVASMESNSRIVDCAKKMAEQKIGCIVVTEKGSLAGIVTEQDLSRKVLANEINPKMSTLRSLMSKNIKFVSPEDDVSKAVELMRQNNIEHLPVIYKDKLVGIVSARDIVKRMSADKYLLLSGKKIFMILAAWVFFIVIYNILSELLNTQSIVIYILATFVVPAYFIISLIYTTISHFLR